MERLIKDLLLGSLAPSTAKKYCASQSLFANFCRSLNVVPVPCAKGTLLKFIVWLRHHRKVGPEALRGYLSAIRHLHIINGVEFAATDDPRVKVVKKAANKREKGKDSRRPITFEILDRFHGYIVRDFSYSNLLFLTASVVGYCGFLRVSEICAVAGASRPSGIRLVDLGFTEGSLVLSIPISKTDINREGSKVFIKPLGDNRTCPIKLLEQFLGRRPRTAQDWPLFIHQDRSPMSAAWFRTALKDKCGALGLTGKFNSHSLRIGAASDASRRGVPGHVIKLLGRWKSDSFERYIRPSGDQLAEAVRTFAVV